MERFGGAKEVLFEQTRIDSTALSALLFCGHDIGEQKAILRLLSGTGPVEHLRNSR
jgi:hypothetical protein